MKNLYLARLLAILICAPIVLYAQVDNSPKSASATKPSLFTALPETLPVTLAELEKLNSVREGAAFTLKCSGGVQFNGTIVSVVHRSANLTSINIKLTQYAGALFNISVEEGKNGLLYKGRILHPQYGDVLLLQAEGQQYQWKKVQQQFFMTE
jgi:hypothetical protein